MKSTTTVQTTASPIDAFLATLPVEKRDALEKLRQAIHAAAPGLEECICYGVPGFRLNGKYLVGFGAAKKHCSFFLGSTIARHADKLKNYETSKGTIRFQPEKSLPASLVKQLIEARVAESQPQKPLKRSK